MTLYHQTAVGGIRGTKQKTVAWPSLSGASIVANYIQMLVLLFKDRFGSSKIGICTSKINRNEYSYFWAMQPSIIFWTRRKNWDTYLSLFIPSYPYPKIRYSCTISWDIWACWVHIWPWVVEPIKRDWGLPRPEVLLPPEDQDISLVSGRSWKAEGLWWRKQEDDSYLNSVCCLPKGDLGNRKSKMCTLCSSYTYFYLEATGHVRPLL